VWWVGGVRTGNLATPPTPATSGPAGRPGVAGNPGDLVGDHCSVCCPPCQKTQCQKTTQCQEALSVWLTEEESAAEWIFRRDEAPERRDDQVHGDSVRAALAAARWCGCPCCRRLIGCCRWFTGCRKPLP
jgi:hypothetical protein